MFFLIRRICAAWYFALAVACLLTPTGGCIGTVGRTSSGPYLVRELLRYAVRFRIAASAKAPCCRPAVHEELGCQSSWRWQPFFLGPISHSCCGVTLVAGH